jgi:hypothetical protein
MMGNEEKGAVRIGKDRHLGKILLETSEIVFRGTDFRLKIPLGDMKDVKTANGELHITTSDGLSIFEVGARAEKWRERILHPKSRAEKLGVKAGMPVRLRGDFAADFLQELKMSMAEILKASSAGDAETTFLAIEGKQSLAAVAKYAAKIKDSEALWVVYPKGKKDVTENDVIGAGRKAGLKDVKVVGFSPTHTALKFVLPLEKR